MNPLDSVHTARNLHARILQSPDLPLEEKRRLAREIAGHLFCAEVYAFLSNRARILFLRLRTHAHVSAQLDPPLSRNEPSIWTFYDELESILS